ncbi:hypothetical protein MTR_5g060440 [Medicago truncatula]|nr:hypothetical protein MTR_5g060440 [Medicago truncatula]
MISSSSSPRTPISPSSHLVPNLSTSPSPIRYQPTMMDSSPSSSSPMDSSSRTPISSYPFVITAETPSPPPAPKKRRHTEHTIEAVRRLDIEIIIETYKKKLQELLTKVNTKEALEEERKKKMRILMSLR